MPVRQLGEWLGVVLLLVTPGVFVAAIWCPFLLSNRLRTLFRRLPFTDSLLVNYLLVMIGLSLPWTGGTGLAFARTPAEDALLANALLDVVFPLSILNLVGLPVGAILVLPRLGIEWVPPDHRGTTWLLLALGAAWYAVVFAAPLFVMSLIFALPT